MRKSQRQTRPAQGKEESIFKHSPFPDPGQAVESGEHTLTGDEIERSTRVRPIEEPEEGAHWESGQAQSG